MEATTNETIIKSFTVSRPSQISPAMNGHEIIIEKFEGDCDVSEMKLNKLTIKSITGSVIAKNTSINEDLNAINAEIGRDLNVYGASIGLNLDAKHASIGRNLNTIDATINGALNANNAKIGIDLDVSFATIGGDLYAINSTVGGDLNLISATIGGDLYAINATVGDRIIVIRATIGGIQIGKVNNKDVLFLKNLPLDVINTAKWHSNEDWETADDIHTSDTTNYLYGYAQAVSTDPKHREMNAIDVGKELYPNLLYLVYTSNEVFRKERARILKMQANACM